MSLWTRLTDDTNPVGRIPIHGFGAVIGEFERGEVTFAQVAAALNLSASEQTELQTWWNDVYNAPGSKLTRQAVEDILIATWEGYYTNTQGKARLGI